MIVFFCHLGQNMAWHSTMIPKDCVCAYLILKRALACIHSTTYNYPQGRRRHGFCFLNRNYSLASPTA